MAQKNSESTKQAEMAFRRIVMAEKPHGLDAFPQSRTVYKDTRLVHH